MLSKKRMSWSEWLKAIGRETRRRLQGHQILAGWDTQLQDYAALIIHAFARLVKHGSIAQCEESAQLSSGRLNTLDCESHDLLFQSSELL